MKLFTLVAAGIAKLFAIAGIICLTASAASAQDRLGGHFGAVFPLVTHVNDNTIGIGDDFKIGFPMGITVKTSDRYAFDLEFVPVIDPREGGPVDVSLTVHPGILRSFGDGWTGGLRMAFDINGASWGFTPLINKGFPNGDHAFFVEGVVPIRFQNGNVDAEMHTAIGFGIHLGIGF